MTTRTPLTTQALITDTLTRIAETTIDPTSRELAEQTLALLTGPELVTERYLPSETDAFVRRYKDLRQQSEKTVLKGDPEPSYRYLGMATHTERVYDIVKDSGFGTRKETIENMSRGDGGANGNLIILEHPSVETYGADTFHVFHVVL